jgi:hypothetical protein
MSDQTFDLGANSKVPLTAIGTDATGAVVPGAVAVFTSSDETILTLQTQADGSTIAARVAASAGSVTVSAKVTNPDGSTATGTLTVSLAAAGAPSTNVTNVEIVPGIAS